MNENDLVGINGAEHFIEALVETGFGYSDVMIATIIGLIVEEDAISIDPESLEIDVISHDHVDTITPPKKLYITDKFSASLSGPIEALNVIISCEYAGINIHIMPGFSNVVNLRS